MRYLLLCVPCLFSYISPTKAQILQAKYDYILSEMATYEEHIYVENGRKISIRDSVRVNKVETEHMQSDDDMYSSSISLVIDAGKNFRKIIIQNNDGKDLIETASFENNNYLLTDKDFPTLIWDTNFDEEEKFGSYTCKKAVANYRGTKLIAYYSTEIPVSAGPYKFNGLPGLIVMVYNEAAYPNYWLLKEVQYPYVGDIPMDEKYIHSLPKLTLEAYVKKEEDKNEQQLRMMRSKLPEGVEMEPTSSKKVRGSVEQIYEWEIAE